MANFSKNLEAFGLTDVGRKRKRNEDFFRYVIPTPNSPEEKLGAFFVVADGIGGMGFGNEASMIATNTLLAAYYDPQNLDPDPLSRLQTAMQMANSAVINKASELGRTLIGTTAAGVIVHPQEVVLFNVGDARVYRIRGNTIERISKDQSVLEEQLALGLVTEEEAAQGRNMNVTAFIGQPGGVTPIYNRFVPQSDDIFLICTDGLWDLFKEAELRHTISKNSPEQAMKHLIGMALDRGAPDNVTGIIIRLAPFQKKRNVLAPALAILLFIIGMVIGVMVVDNLGGDDKPTPPVSNPTAIAGATDTASNVIILTSEIVETTPESTDDTAQFATETTTVNTSTPISIVVPPIATTKPANTSASSDVTDEATTRATGLEQTAQSVASIGTSTNIIVIIVTATPTSSYTPSPTQPATHTPSPTPTHSPSPTSTPSNTVTPSLTPSRTPSLTPSPTQTPTPTQTPQPSPMSTNTPQPTPTQTPAPPTATLDSQSLTLLAPFTATARANLPFPTQTALSIQETQAVIDVQNTQTQVAFNQTLTVVYTQTLGAQTLQAVQTQVIGTATARAEVTSEITPEMVITPPSLPNQMVVATQDVYLYQLPDVRSQMLLPLFWGDEITVLGISPTGTWFYVEIRDQIRGWVQRFPNQQLTAYVSQIMVETLPIIDSKMPFVVLEETFGVHLVTNDLPINVREYASTDPRSNPFTGLEPFSVARIDATNPNRTWLRVSFIGRNNRPVRGWVSGQLIRDGLITIVGDLNSVRRITPPPLPEPEKTDEASALTPAVTEQAPQTEPPTP